MSLLATFGVALIFGHAPSGKESPTIKSPEVSVEVITNGRRLFVSHCAECHGFNARGDEGSDLHNLQAGDVLIRQLITGGIKGEMPAYGKTLGEEDLRALLVYLRTLKN
jgi:mono/diheme cytochrome c family protein